MPKKTTPTIFLSYAWKNADVAEAIDNDFKRIGITFKRDIRDLPYRTSIKEFMRQVGKTDFVLMLITHDYLTSENCMHEATELLNTREFKKRVLPVILDDAKMIFKAKERKKYYDAWKAIYVEAETLLKEYPNKDFIEHHKKCLNIFSQLDIFFELITDMNISAFDKLKNESYIPLLNIVGFKNEVSLDSLLEIDEMEVRSDQEKALSALLRKSPSNKNILFLRAFLADENNEYEKAKKYYQILLKKYPSEATGHSNFAALLENHFNDYEAAKFHYEQALKFDPLNASSHTRLAILFEEQFSDYDNAKLHYEKAIDIDPQNPEANLSFGNLLKTRFLDPKNAKKHLLSGLYPKPIN